ncbi:ATP synthase F1 subunit gamma [Estrella lausannensis]|uniref:ATP synthase gamma chain n=1 Tax=Estrella lausannensis TaxID=483423 RepID=A0A0H5DSY1_9BACT|nr:ATP synthase F1 subunit gamma [Estrella lausannensis]CRX38929.1 ATP synthase subunit gamma [Estrella lausannensis]
MSSLREIKKRLRAVKNIKQITKAMELVAASRLHKAQEKALGSRTYSKKLRAVLENLSLVKSNHPFFSKRPVKKMVLIIITSDRGLCGGYNTHIINAAERFLHKYPQNQPELIVMGRKGLDHFRLKNWTIREKVLDWGGKITPEEVKKLSNYLLESFLHYEIDEVTVIYTEYVNLLTRKVITEKLLGIEKMTQSQKEVSKDYIFEPDSEEIYDDLVPRYVYNRLQTILHQAWASELGARVCSMRQAIKNADEMIEKLTLTRNKVRQASITREMAEIASGSEGLNNG